ncbi:D(4) dopamine receptor isoform X2 [Pipistrellus kuhlii]|uniref:Dopamine receptor D4 n=1 Tax=Pipistrellus kuhlii TaxID=59472 RepID=A0A7J7QVW8_PIPKU|nr:D(4) dopamine receptor isoform X2 [Pipistrellus kuhlii]KAF6267943.1 dopamine receptor D4 [Pipistrellus kuhlii]
MGNRSAAGAAGAALPGLRGGGAGAAALAGGVLLIGAVLAGNSLVCVSVAAERALRTPANYFVLSLAAADLLLALLVLPLFVYSEAQGGVWLLGPRLCDALMAMDVMLCTASIFNLCAISVDRFVAVARPLRYNRPGRGGRQLLLIGATWLLAAAVAAPVLCGLNDTRGRDPTACRLEDRDYVVYSSVCSFLLPCPLLLLLSAATFRGLRRWGAARRAKLLARAPRRPSGPGPPPPAAAAAAPAAGPPPPPPAPPPARRRRAQTTGRERKAMRVLPVVVGAFLVCWTPFFVVHVTRALCAACAVPPRLVSAVTWLGYLNSALNPLLYSLFHAGFRSAFRKALRPCC